MLPRWKALVGAVIVFVLVAFVVANIQLQLRIVQPRKYVGFNVLFRYGVTSRNELNTFNSTYTKDMVLDPPITIWLYLSDEEMNQIRQKVVEINLFNLPETISSRNDGWRIEPQDNFFLMVQNGSTIKTVTWNSNSEVNEVEQNLTQLANLIESIVEQRPEFKALPLPNGGYC